MRAYGSDRVRAAGERLILRCHRSKGWTGRTERTLTSREHPGTAVEWDDAWYEVLSATQEATAIQYVLAPWAEHHAIRVTSRYDQASEEERERTYQREMARARSRKWTNFLGLFAGHLPAAVQTQLGNELGVSPTRLSLVSLILPYVLFAVCIFAFVDGRMKQQPSVVPVPVLVVAWLMFVESAVRMYVLLSQSRPVGSVIGLLAYSLYYQFSRNRAGLVGPIAGGRGDGTFTLPPDADVAARDSLAMKSPMLTLLTAEEQRDLAERHGFTYKPDAYVVATIILLAAGLGVVSSFLRMLAQSSVSAFLSMAIAGALAAEQVYRLLNLRQRPVGSFLGIVVRPFVRSLLERR